MIFSREVTNEIINRLRLQFVEPGVCIPIRLMVYNQPTGSSVSNDSDSTTIAVTAWADAVSGVLTDRIVCLPGSYLVIPSTARGGVGRRFTLIVYSSACPVTVILANP